MHHTPCHILHPKLHDALHQTLPHTTHATPHTAPNDCSMACQHTVLCLSLLMGALPCAAPPLQGSCWPCSRHACQSSGVTFRVPASSCLTCCSASSPPAPLIAAKVTKPPFQTPSDSPSKSLFQTGQVLRCSQWEVARELWNRSHACCTSLLSQPGKSMIQAQCAFPLQACLMACNRPIASL